MSGRRRRLSPVRLVAVLTAVTMVFGGTAWAVAATRSGLEAEAAVVFSPYVDVSLTPTHHFEDLAESRAQAITLGFVVAEEADSCEPTWGTYYDLDAAARALDLDRRMVRFRQAGGHATVSFGGQANDELAVACSSGDDLVSAYRSVVDRYEVDTLDFDIEGDALRDRAANRRRSDALARLQAESADHLDIWLTLPVDPGGLTPDGVAVVDGLLEAGVDLAGVNVMTMNYGASRTAGLSMGDASIAALRSTHRQLTDAYAAAAPENVGIDVWSRLGATPMIGQNDVPTDRFDVHDAAELAAFASDVGLGKLSMWSANRDQPCDPQWQAGDVSNTCSGVDQEPGEFAGALTRYSPDDGNQAASDTTRPVVTRDDPAASPYPIWRDGRQYSERDKVVWHGGVYEAKWYAEAAPPDALVDEPWDTPWRYLGPVLDADAEIVAGARAAHSSDRPQTWNPDAVYEADSTVLLGHQVFRAAWWTQGDRPSGDPAEPFDHPWELVADFGPTG